MSHYKKDKVMQRMSLEEISTDDAFCLTDEDPGVQRANEDNPFSGMQIRH